MKLPEIRINFSGLLYKTVSRRLAEAYEHELPAFEECREKAEAYRKEWAKHEKKILTSMQDILDLEFYKSVVDVSLAPFIIPMSEPTIIHFRSTPDEFVDVLTHELLHVLLTDNKIVSVKDNNLHYQLTDTWANLFGEDHDRMVLAHIPVHAVHKKIYSEVLRDESRLLRDLEHSRKSNSDAYVKSWGYVDEHGAESIIEKLKKSYEKIAVELGAKK